MKRYGQIIKLKHDKIAEYKKLHSAVWDDILALIKDCNIRNYSIYLKGDLLFAYFEYVGDDYEKDMQKMESNPVNQKWWEACKPCREPVENRKEGEWWSDMEEVFHLD